MKQIEPMPMDDTVEDTEVSDMGQSLNQIQESPGTDIGSMLEQRLNELPDNQKQFISQYLAAPETSVILGLILGPEALNYFSQFTDPSVALQVTNREQPSPQSPPTSGPEMGLMASAPKSSPSGGLPAMGTMMS